MKRFRPAIAALAGLLALSACAGGTGDDAGSGTPQDGGTLKLSFWPDNANFSCIDPFQVYWIEHRSIIRNFADSLTDQDPQTGRIVPWLADKWEISPDGLAYTFTLKDGVTFANGVKLDAQAVADNAEGWIETVEATNGAAYGASYIQGLTGAEVVDPRTVKLTLSKPNSSFLQATSTTNLAIIDPAAFARTPADRCLGTGVVGSGLFQLDHYTPKVETVLTKRAGYTWGSELAANRGEARLDRVEFSYVAEDSVRTGNLVSGAIDIAWPRNPFTPQDETLITRSGATVEKRSLPGVASTLFSNTTAGRPLADPQIRKALSKAIDTRTYATTIFGADYPEVQGPFNATTPYFKSEAAKVAHDLAGARQILDAAGWTVGPDGYRVKDGKQLVIDYPLPSTATGPGPELLQAQVKEAGIKLELRTLTTAQSATYLAEGSYDLTGTYFTRADPGALQFIINPDVANSKALASRIGSADEINQVKALFAEAIETTDAAQTQAAYAELQDYLIDQALTIPLFERVQKAGVARNVHGFAFTSESFLKLNDVWKS
ncbi:ABC transporter substrate-binding protein [Actinoplanes sp. NBRC 101535]|uniref:ABC transporter substrate-binding protein n=1 Tax=Actinoplanes sp. NBRC 101535 TaxID=3032196 RepID=UPI0024A28BAA|nr:ABC transporter substrate-binding protein [Actinoplanes sp. NBRC 101535]GLY00414.1 ABC transporter substrate-binding protein [Actinoplanes sp. NBRC 101535]